MQAGLLEGRELGLQKGWEIGQEVGFYAGCVQVRTLHACTAQLCSKAELLMAQAYT